MLLITSMAFGNLGGALQLCRLLTILFLPKLIKKFGYCNGTFKNYWYFFVTFILYSCISLLWTPDKLEGVTQLVYFIIHFLFFFELLIFSKLANNAIDSISQGWMYAIAITLIVALWEIITDNHLSISAHESERMINTGEAVFQQRFASVTFYNYNSYVTFLCFALPFVFYRITRIRSVNLKIITPIIVVLLSCFCILCNASRGGLLSIAIMLLIYTIRQPNNKFKFLTITIFIVIGVWILIQYANILFLAISVRSSAGGLFEDSSRFYIWAVAILTIIDTFGFGTGIGGINAGMAKFTNGITVPHNLFLEILTEFGVVFFSIFMYFIIRLYGSINKVKNYDIKTILYVFLIPLPIYCIIDSGYLLNYWVFAAFASLICFINFGKRKFT